MRDTHIKKGPGNPEYDAWAAARTSAARDDLARPRRLIVASMVLAFVTELVSRNFYDREVYLASELLSFFALMLLSTAAIYLIFHLGRRGLLKFMVVTASASMLLSQLLAIAKRLPLTPPLTEQFPFLAPDFEGPMLILGLLLLLATYYLALLEAVVVKSQLRIEQLQLYDEIAERTRAQTELRASRDQIRRLSAHLETASEQERARLAREVHDELGQTLTGLKFDLNNLEVWARDSMIQEPRFQELLEVMKTQVNATVRTTRRMMTELHPAVLDDLGLQAAIEGLVLDCERRTGMKCSYHSDDDYPILDRDTNTALYRIAQECITNVTRHSGATSLDVRYEVAPECIMLTVEDNGRGIEAATDEAEYPTFGILGMRERVELRNGEFSIQSEPGRGTKVSISIPYLMEGTKENV